MIVYHGGFDGRYEAFILWWLAFYVHNIDMLEIDTQIGNVKLQSVTHKVKCMYVCQI